MTAHRSSLLALALAGCGGGGVAPDAPSPDGQVIDAVALDAAVDAMPLVCPSITRVTTASADEVALAGDTGSTSGVMAPSIVGDAMSYTSVPDAATARTRVATTTDGGATWTFAVEADAPVATTITSTDQTECPLGQCAGNLVSVASTLVHDETATDARVRWKLFAQRYLVSADGTPHVRYGTITMQTAPAPAGPWTAPAPLLGWDSPSSVSSDGVVLDVSTVPSLADCTNLSRPGAVAVGDRIDLAVGCVFATPQGPRTRIVELSSTDHAASFTFTTTLLGSADGACLGGTSIDAPFFFGAYVGATAVGPSGDLGCLVWSDPSMPPVRALAATPARAVGGCAYTDALGYVLPVAFSDAPPRVHRLFASTVPAP